MQWVVICPTMHAQFVGLNSLICSYADGEKSCSDTSLELGLCVDGKHDWNEPKLPSCFPFASLLCRRCNTQGVFSQGFKCRLDYFLLSKSFPLVKKKKKKNLLRKENVVWGSFLNFFHVPDKCISKCLVLCKQRADNSGGVAFFK